MKVYKKYLTFQVVYSDTLSCLNRLSADCADVNVVFSNFLLFSFCFNAMVAIYTKPIGDEKGPKTIWLLHHPDCFMVHPTNYDSGAIFNVKCIFFTIVFGFPLSYR